MASNKGNSALLEVAAFAGMAFCLRRRVELTHGYGYDSPEGRRRKAEKVEVHNSGEDTFSPNQVFIHVRGEGLIFYGTEAADYMCHRSLLPVI